MRPPATSEFKDVSSLTGQGHDLNHWILVLDPVAVKGLYTHPQTLDPELEMGGEKESIF